MEEHYNMKKSFKNRLLSLLISLNIVLLSGCYQPVDCNVKKNHIHSYISEQGIERYITGEREYVGGFSSIRYDRTENYVELDDSNIDIYSLISKKNLVNITDNYDILKEISDSALDYMLYQYSYNYTTITYNIILKIPTTKNEIKYEWTTNPNHENLTGNKKIITHVFYGYNIIKNDKGNYTLVSSGPINSLDLLIEMGYQYVDADIMHEMNKEDYLKLVGIEEDTNEYIEEFDGEKVIFKLK